MTDMQTTFQLHPQLETDTIQVGRFELCRLLMMNDCQYPWFILVPERIGLTEIYQLSREDQIALTAESSYLAEKLAVIFKADKLNIAAIGNLVPQLHIHHVVRYRDDPCWPAPIWGKFPVIPYSEQQITAQLDKLRAMLAIAPV